MPRPCHTTFEEADGMLFRELGRKEAARKLRELTDAERQELTMMSVGRRLKWLLDYLHGTVANEFTPNQVAKRVGVSSSALYHVILEIKGAPSAATGLALARELGVPMEFIYTGEVTRETQDAPPIDHLGEELRDFVADPATATYVRTALLVAKRAWTARLPVESFQVIADSYMQVALHPNRQASS
jgi:transcriptional regulator with XRE-family HTH domain